MPITYHSHQGRTIRKAIESEFLVGHRVGATVDEAVSVNASPASAVGLSSQADVEVVSGIELSSAIPVGHDVGSSVDEAAKVSASPTSAVGLSTAEEHEVISVVEADSTISVGQQVGASVDEAAQVSASPSSQVDVSTSEGHVVGVAKSVSSVISVGQQVGASVDEAAKVTASPTSAVDLSSSTTKEIELPLYERTATSTIDVGRSVSTSVDTAAQVTASPTSQVGVSSTQSSTVDLNINPSEPFQNDLPDYDALWTDGATDYSDLSDVLEGSIEARVDLSGTATGVIAESGGAGDDGTALVVHEDGGTRTLMAMVGDGEDLVDGDHAVVEYDISGLSGYHNVGWSADASDQTLVLYVDGAVVGKDTYFKEGTSQGRLAGGGTGTVGTNSSGVRELGLGWSSADYTYDGNIQWCTVYTGVSTDDVVAPVYERTASSAIDVEQSVSASVDTSTQVTVSPTSAVDLSSSTAKEIELPLYERTASSAIDVGQSVNATTDTSQTVSVSPTSQVGVNSSVDSEQYYSIFEGFTRDARWDSVGTEYTDLDGATTATAHIRADLGLADTGILMEHGARGDGLAVAVVTDEDGSGTELRGTERILAMFGEGSTTTGTDTAVLDHRLGYRITDVDTTLDNYSTVLEGDWRDDIEAGYEIGWESETGTDTVDAVTYSSANNETTIEHGFRDGDPSDTVYFVQDRVEVTWSADTGVGQCVLYEDGTPVDTDPLQNSRLCGGDNGTIGDEGAGGVRELGQNWSSADYDYENVVYFADIYLDETTAQVVSEYKTEDLPVTPAIYRSTGLRYGRDGQGNQTVDLGTVSSARAYVNINGDPDVEDGIVAHWGAGGDGAILYTHDGNLYLQVGDGGTVGGSAECIVFDIEDGAHIIEWTANIGAGELELWVDGVKEDTATGWSYAGDLAGSDFDGIGRRKGSLPTNRGDFSVSGGRLNRDVKKAETYEGASWVTQVFERSPSSTIDVGQSITTSVDTSSGATASPTSSVGVSSSATTEVDTPATVSPSTVFTNLGSYTANWDDVSVDYTEMSSIAEGSAEVQAYYESGYTGVLMEAGGGQVGLALAITDNDDLLIMAGDGGNTLPSNGVAVASVSMSGYSSGTYKFGWSCSDNTEQVALYINGSVVDTGTFTSIHNDIAGGNDGGIKTRHAGGLRNLGQGWTSGTDWTYNGTIDWCVVYPGDITPDVQQTNSAPNADLVVTDDPSGDLVVEADATGSSDPDNDSLTYDYDWGDGLSDSGAGSTQTHLYQSEGTYTVTVTVDDGSLTDQASDTVTVSESSSSEVVHDFEGSDEGWISVEAGIGRDNAYGRGGSAWSYGGDVNSAGSGEAAYVEPPELSGGNKIESLTFHYLEESSSFGGGVRLYDSSGSSVIGLLTDNPEWKVLNGSGSITQLYDGNGQYQDWIRVEVTFDWPAGTADVTYTNESTGTDRTETGVSIGGNGVEKIQLTNYQGGNFGSGNLYYWIDDLKFVPSTSTSGPSFSDGVSESFTKEGSSSASHSASWDGSAAPYTFEIFKDSSETTLIWSDLTNLTSNNASNYQTVDISDLTFGSLVYFKVTDDNGNSSTTTVSTSVAF